MGGNHRLYWGGRWEAMADERKADRADWGERLLEELNLIQVFGLIDTAMARYVIGALNLLAGKNIKHIQEGLDDYGASEDEAKATLLPVIIQIDSPGGYVAEALAISDAMRAFQGRVVTQAVGQCSSAAALLLASGSPGWRTSYPNISFLFHRMTMGAVGDVDVMASEAGEGRRTEEVLRRVLVEMTGLPEERIRELETGHTYLSPPEMVEHGFIDEIYPLRGQQPKSKRGGKKRRPK